MDEKSKDSLTQAGIIVGGEVFKALIMLAFQSAQRYGLDATQQDALYLSTKATFQASNVEQIRAEAKKPSA